MDTTHKRGETKKALYVFLCSLLGMLIFIILQKSTLLLLTILLGNQGDIAVEGYASPFYQFETISYLVALFFGGWYGVWLGLHWYGIVYEAGRGGLLYAFWGNLMHHEAPREEKAATSPARASAPVVNSMPSQAKWQFDDLAKLKAPSRPMSTEPDEWSTKVQVKPSVASNPNSRPAAKKAVKKTTVQRTAPLEEKPKKAVRRRTTAKKTTVTK